MALIRVFQLPDVFAKDFLFGKGENIIFTQVDWFRDDHFPFNQDTKEVYVSWLKRKPYATKPLLVLHPELSLTIDYEAS